MKKLNLMVDIDDVLFPLIDGIHDVAIEQGLHDGSVGPEWAGWELYGCTEERYWDLWVTFSARNGYLNTPPIPGRLEALRHLYLEGHTINLVTARGFFSNGDDVKNWTREWIEEFAVPHHTLTFAKDKVGSQAELGAFDLAIDDSPHNYTALEQAGVNVWMQNHHHNRLFEAEARVEDLWEWATIAHKLATA